MMFRSIYIFQNTNQQLYNHDDVDDNFWKMVAVTIVCIAITLTQKPYIRLYCINQWPAARMAIKSFSEHISDTLKEKINIIF